MQRRVLSSLEEDFEEIGLNRKVTDVGVFGSLDEELQVAERFGDTLEEALKVQKTVRMSPAERALARADYRKQKSVIKTKRKKLRKKPAFKRHAKKLAKATKGKKKSPRRRFMVTGLEQIGSLQESIQKFAAELDGNKKDEMILALENVASVAGLLAERLDEAEAYVDEISEMQDAVCDTDEEFGDKEYGDIDNLADVTDDHKGGVEDEDVDLSRKKTIADAKKVIAQKFGYKSPESVKIISSGYPMRKLDDDDEIEGQIWHVALDEHGDAPVYVDAPNREEAEEAAEEWWSKRTGEKDVEAVHSEVVVLEDRNEDVDDGGDVGGGEMGDELAFLDDEEGEDEEDSEDEEEVDESKVEVDDDGTIQAININDWEEVVGSEYEGKGQEITLDGQRYKVTGTAGDMVQLQSLDTESKTESKSNRISDNLRTLKTEATELLQQFKKDAITPADAESVLRDMVSYLGGAINTFANIAKGLEGYRDEVGQDQPKEVKPAKLDTEGDREIVGQDKDLDSEGKVAVEKETREVVGQDDPESVNKAPEGQSEKRKVTGEDDKLDSVGKAPEGQSEKRTVVGQDKIDDKLDMGTNSPKLNQVNQKGKGELSVIESLNLDRFTKELVESVANGLNDENRKQFLALPKQKLVEAAYAVVGSKKKN